MRKHKKLKGSFKREPEYWGQLSTADHITSVRDTMLGVTGDKDVFTVMDVYSGLRGFYPTPDKSAKETAKALRYFVGDRKVMRLYSDNSGEIGAALKKMNILAEHAEPGEPRTNTLAETNNRILLDGVRTSLSSAGLPACFWVWAGPHFLCVVWCM